MLISTIHRISMVLCVALMTTSGCSDGDQAGTGDVLSEYGGLQALVEADDEYLPTRENEVQHWVADCMSRAGFEYVAWSPPTVPATVGDTDTPSVDAYERDLTQPPIQEDPNTVIYDNLPFAQQTLYFERLWGRESQEPGMPSNGEVDEVGCYNAAWVQLYGPESVQARWTLGDATEEIQQRLNAHPDYIDERNNWNACMVSQGFQVSESSSLDSIVRSEIWAEDPSLPLGQIDFDALRTKERNIRAANASCAEDLDSLTAELLSSFQSELLREMPTLRESIDLVAGQIAERSN